MNCRILLLIVLVGCSVSGWAQSDCAKQAKTDLERLYCQIQLTPHASKLPGFNDFRNNNPKVQQSLLRGPARSLGLTLPEVAAKRNNSQPSAPTPRANRPAQAPPASAVAMQAEVSISLGPRQEPKKTEREVVQPANPLSTCHLLGKRIDCSRRQFVLQQNQNNRLLTADALSANNVLLMAEYKGDPANDAALQDYLLDSYRIYIEKMLVIGLGGATMSYTKFYYTYQELFAKRENFAQRFGLMYEYLKKDKASMAIKSAYHDKLPGDLSQCGALSDEVVVCDDGATNWVYVSG